MKKTFVNPEMEVLRFQKCTDIMTESLGVSNSPATSDYRSLSRGKHDDDDDF